MQRDTSPAVQKALMYYLGHRLLNEILDQAVSATGAQDWGGNTGCFPTATKAFDSTWEVLLEEGCELSLTVSKAVSEAIIQGTTVEQNRLGRRWCGPVLRHLKASWHQAPTWEDPCIHDATSVGPSWDTFKTVFDLNSDVAIPDSLIERLDAAASK